MPSTETPLVHAIVKAILREYPDAWTFKVHGSPYQRAGVPDLLVCVHGSLFGFEVKHQKPDESEQHARGRATLLQRNEIRDIRQAGGYAAVILSPEEALEAIQEICSR